VATKKRAEQENNARSIKMKNHHSKRNRSQYVNGNPKRNIINLNPKEDKIIKKHFKFFFLFKFNFGSNHKRKARTTTPITGPPTAVKE
jgi:hypothetical protein